MLLAGDVGGTNTRLGLLGAAVAAAATAHDAPLTRPRWIFAPTFGYTPRESLWCRHKET